MLLSDGEDTSSLVTFEDVLDLARRSETAIYAIGLMEEGAGGQSKGFREATYALRQLATDTGGRAFFPADIKSLAVGVRPDLRRAVEPVHDRLHLQEPAPGRRLAAPRRSRHPAEHAGPHQAGILRATRADRS